MKCLKLTKLIFLSFGILMISCDDEGPSAPEPEPLVPEQIEPITILGKWFFTDASTELISKKDNEEIIPPNYNISNLEWTFLENDSLFVMNQDETGMFWYNYDTANMRLDISDGFSDGFYDVLQHTKDSLNLRFYTDITVAEFYIYFQLTR